MSILKNGKVFDYEKIEIGDIVIVRNVYKNICSDFVGLVSNISLSKLKIVGILPNKESSLSKEMKNILNNFVQGNIIFGNYTIFDISIEDLIKYELDVLKLEGSKSYEYETKI